MKKPLVEFEYEVGLELVEGRMAPKTCNKPARRFEYWFMCDKHIRAILRRLDLIKRGKLTNFELKIKQKGEKQK